MLIHQIKNGLAVDEHNIWLIVEELRRENFGVTIGTLGENQYSGHLINWSVVDDLIEYDLHDLADSTSIEANTPFEVVRLLVLSALAHLEQV